MTVKQNRGCKNRGTYFRLEIGVTWENVKDEVRERFGVREKSLFQAEGKASAKEAGK